MIQESQALDWFSVTYDDDFIITYGGNDDDDNDGEGEGDYNHK